ncbi:MAG TPA: dihydrofolate reductase family protein, partial [Polyangiaceae bacterium]|nr:dihydrofolate reductase family protein [Polyangiaceae bacterium]
MNTSLRPLVRLHYAQSLDGRIGWMGLETRLSSREGLLLAQRERSASDAVLVGSGTLRIDDPRLTVREYQGRQPRRVVLSRDLNVPSTAKIFGPGGAVVIIGREDLAPLHERERLAALGAEVCLV